MKAKTLLTIAAGVMALVSAVFAAALHLEISSYQKSLLGSETAYGIAQDVFERNVVGSDYLFFGSDRARDQWSLRQSKIETQIEQLAALSENQEEVAELEAGIKVLMSQSEEIFAKLILLKEGSENTSAENLTRLASQLNVKSQQTVAAAETAGKIMGRESRAALDRFILLFSVITSLFFLLLIVSFFLIRRSVEELSKVDELKSDFVSLVSHQLKTPVAQIKGYAENMLDGLTGPITPKQKDYLEDMIHVANKNSKLIDDLLNVSRIERQMLKVNLENLPVMELLTDVLSPLQSVAAKKGVKLVENIPATNAKIVGDTVKTREALRNIVDNALKFTEPGKSVTVTAQEEATTVAISIQDEGPGIDPDVQKEIFEKNRVWAGKVKASGAGLGLFLSKQFIELTGGTIGFNTVPGKGTVFTINLRKA